MCGVIGIGMQRADLDLIHRVFSQSMIRGKHATGISYVKGGEIRTVKEGIPADRFLDKNNLQEFVHENGGIYMIGHIRYSTSDLAYHQPFANKEIAIAHNGVISQEDKSTWKYDCQTGNDSELILRSIEEKNHPLTDFVPSSQAVVAVNLKRQIHGWRNEARPLWYSPVEGGVVFTSTKDIALRSGLTSPTKCDMYSLYRFNVDELEMNVAKVDYDDSIEDMQ
jgi:glutamine phosphoribosylpyrophosphate amidotransferase